MSRSGELLKSILSHQPSWNTRQMIAIKTAAEMLIIPPTAEVKEPLLKMESKDDEGNVVHVVTMNISAIDDQVGKLIRMRDLMAAMISTER